LTETTFTLNYHSFAILELVVQSDSGSTFLLAQVLQISDRCIQSSKVNVIQLP